MTLNTNFTLFWEEEMNTIMNNNLETLRRRYEQLLQQKIQLAQQINAAERRIQAIDMELASITQQLWQATGVVGLNNQNAL